MEETVASGLCWIVPSRSYKRNLLQFSDLPDELLLPGELNSVFFFLTLESTGDFIVHLISHLSFLSFDLVHFLSSNSSLVLNRSNQLLLHFHVLSLLNQELVLTKLTFHFQFLGVQVILLKLVLLGLNGLLSEQLHLDLHSLSVFDLLDLLFLPVLLNPSLILTIISHVHLEILKHLLLLLLFLLQKSFFSDDSGSVKLNVSLLLLKVRHLYRMLHVELHLPSFCIFKLLDRRF